MVSAVKLQLINYINELPEYKLISLEPLLKMLVTDTFHIENIQFNDLEEDEKEAVIKSLEEFENGETYDADDIDWDNLENLVLN